MVGCAVAVTVSEHPGAEVAVVDYGAFWRSFPR
jgi:hypothetical protein